MSIPPRQHNEQQQTFLRQGTILRRNLSTWDETLRSARGEDWPSMLGRLNAAFVRNDVLGRVVILFLLLLLLY